MINKKSNPEKTAKQLATYGAMAAAMLGITNDADATIQYTDIDPDTLITGHGTVYDLDLNNDGADDFRFTLKNINSTLFASRSIKIQPLGDNLVLATHWLDAKKLEKGDIIETSANWGPQYGILPMAEFYYTYSHRSSGGPFYNVDDKYVGLKLEVNNLPFYGWARVDFVGASKITIKDYAYEDSAYHPILAGYLTDVPADTVTSLVAIDKSDHGDSRDLQISFNKVADESTIDGYRAFVVKSSNSGNFDLTAALNVAPWRFLAISKTNNNITMDLGNLSEDVDGDLILNHISYKVFIMSLENGTHSGVSSLAASNEITLYSPFAYPVNNIKLEDYSNFQDGRDIRVDFNNALNENTIAHYRVIMVKSADAATFDLNMANNLAPGNYTTVPKVGYPIRTNLDSTATDKDGNLIQPGIGYKAFVLSVADGMLATVNTLAGASNEVTLVHTGVAEKVTIGNVSDIDNYQDGRDLEIEFYITWDESTIAEYRAIAVKDINSPDFDMTAANSLMPGRYQTFAKTGSNITGTFSSNSLDSDGDPIRENIDYRIYILSVADGFHAVTNALSDPSQPIKLTHTITTDSVTNVIASDIDDHNDGRDLQVSFSKVSDESKIDHYRVLVIKSGSAPAFDLNTANDVPDEFSVKIQKSGKDILTTLGKYAKDVDGAYIRENVPYKIFILSMADGTNAGVNNLSKASNHLVLTTMTSGIETENRTEIKINPADQLLHIEISQRKNQTVNVAIYALNGQLLDHRQFETDHIRFRPNLSPNNIYIVEVKAGAERMVKKIKF